MRRDAVAVFDIDLLHTIGRAQGSFAPSAFHLLQFLAARFMHIAQHEEDLGNV
jgi:hypothetical protein